MKNQRFCWVRTPKINPNQIDHFKSTKTVSKIGHSVREDRSANYQNCHRRCVITVRSLRWLRGHERDRFAAQAGIEGFD